MWNSDERGVMRCDVSVCSCLTGIRVTPNAATGSRLEPLGSGVATGQSRKSVPLERHGLFLCAVSPVLARVFVCIFDEDLVVRRVSRCREWRSNIRVVPT